MSTVVEFVEKCAKAGHTLAEAQPKAVEQSALFAKRVMVAGAQSVNTPTTLRSGGTARWGARYTLHGKDPATATVYIYGAAPYWRQRGIGKHFIVSKGIRGGRSARGLRAARSVIGADHLLRKGESARSSQAVLHWGGVDGGFSTRVLSPGVKARPFWDPIPVTVAKESEAVYHAAMIGAVVEAGFGR